MLLITFDGLSGSGKTTQARKLAKLLDLRVYNPFADQNFMHHFFYTMTRSYEISNLVLGNIALFNIKTQQFLRENRKGYIVEERFFTLLAELDSNELPMALDIFRKGLKLGGLYEPSASFYIHVPPSISTIRVFNRVRKRHGLETVKFEDIQEQSEIGDAWKWLESNLPYFHIINGLQDEDSVTQDIMTILQKEGII